MAAQLHLHESVTLSDPSLVHRILVQSQAQAATEVHDTTHMSWCLVHCARVHNLIQGTGSASLSSIELVLVHMPSSPPATGTVCLGDTSDADRSEGALSNPESHTLGLPIVGGASSLLPQRTGVHACMLESDPGRSSVSVSSSSAAVSSVMTNQSYTSTVKQCPSLPLKSWMGPGWIGRQRG